ncbi:MAG: MarR family transcriptional regulator [Bryobacterales bacterium]|nr:MarR family transcriptional regulator [Bryobacterales bacterium]
MVLKPQDVYVLLKLVASGGRRPPYSQLAAELSMSPSEVHACVKRAQTSGLLHGPALEDRPNISAMEEFLLHGLKYVFPAERGEMSRGVATAYGAEPLRSLIAETDEPIPVWPHAEGHQRGVSLTPLYKTAPDAALRDESFHQLLALVDALRDGRVRERKIAEAELHRRLKPSHATIEP